MSTFKEFLERVLPVAQKLGPRCTPETLAWGLKSRLSESELKSLIRELDDLTIFFARQAFLDAKQWDILHMLLDIRKELA